MVSIVVHFLMRHASFSNPLLIVVSRTDHLQNGQDILDILVKLKISIVTRCMQWRSNPSPV